MKCCRTFYCVANSVTGNFCSEAFILVVTLKRFHPQTQKLVLCNEHCATQKYCAIASNRVVTRIVQFPTPEERILALGAVISGIVQVDKC